LALLGTSEEAFGPTSLAVCDGETGQVYIREIPAHVGLNLAWLAEPEIGNLKLEIGNSQSDHEDAKGHEGARRTHRPSAISHEALVVQLGRLAQDKWGRPLTEPAGLWLWTFSTDAWEPLTIPGLSEAAYLLADGLEGGMYAFFDPVTTALFLIPLPGSQFLTPNPLTPFPSSILPQWPTS